ncbi:hypothetical protein Tco_1143295 [Tanacetum coccineum]
MNNDKIWKDQNDSLIVELNCKMLKINDLKAQLQDKIIANAEMYERLNALKGKSYKSSYSSLTLDAQNLEVPFRKSTRFVRDLEGNDLLSGTRYNLYTISLRESSSPTPICFMAKTSSTQAWL